jgi:hypothetical protein
MRWPSYSIAAYGSGSDRVVMGAGDSDLDIALLFSGHNKMRRMLMIVG